MNLIPGEIYIFSCGNKKPFIPVHNTDKLFTGKYLKNGDMFVFLENLPRTHIGYFEVKILTLDGCIQLTNLTEEEMSMVRIYNHE